MLHVITGASCSGKSTYAREHASDGDLIVDFNAIAQSMGAPSHGSEGHIKAAAFKAREAAIAYAIDNAKELDSYIIHTAPAGWQMAAYESAGAEFIEMDTDMETYLARCEQDGRPDGTAERIRDWFNGKKGTTMIRYKTAEAELDEDGGVIKGYASTFDRIPDSYGDVVAKGAFAKTLETWAQREQPVPILWGHRTDDPRYNIGAVTEIHEDERGLYFEGVLDAENETAQYARRVFKQGRAYQFSFAFAVLDEGEVTLEDGTKANELRELELYEISLVQIPANQNAQVVEVKAGRRNSRKDEGDLRRIRDLVDEIEEVIDRLLDEPVGESTEEPENPNEDEPQANSDEGEKANVQALIDEAEKLLTK